MCPPKSRIIVFLSESALPTTIDSVNSRSFFRVIVVGPVVAFAIASFKPEASVTSSASATAGSSTAIMANASKIANTFLHVRSSFCLGRRLCPQGKHHRGTESIFCPEIFQDRRNLKQRGGRDNANQKEKNRLCKRQKIEMKAWQTDRQKSCLTALFSIP